VRRKCRMKSCDCQIVLIIVRVRKKLQFRDLNACPATGLE